IQSQEKADTSRGIPGGDGPGGALGLVAGADRAILSSGWPRPAPVPDRDDVAGSLDAKLVWAERPGDGRGAVRQYLDATIRAADVDAGDTGRDNDTQLSPAA